MATSTTPHIHHSTPLPPSPSLSHLSHTNEKFQFKVLGFKGTETYPLLVGVESLRTHRNENAQRESSSSSHNTRRSRRLQSTPFPFSFFFLFFSFFVLTSDNNQIESRRSEKRTTTKGTRTQPATPAERRIRINAWRLCEKE